jgi:hypothetical protein
LRLSGVIELGIIPDVLLFVDNVPRPESLGDGAESLRASCADSHGPFWDMLRSLLKGFEHRDGVIRYLV